MDLDGPVCMCSIIYFFFFYTYTHPHSATQAHHTSELDVMRGLLGHTTGHNLIATPVADYYNSRTNNTVNNSQRSLGIISIGCNMNCILTIDTLHNIRVTLLSHSDLHKKWPHLRRAITSYGLMVKLRSGPR